MKYLLDTDTCIAYVRNRPSTVRSRMRLEQPRDITLCAVVKAELLYGAMRSARPEQNTAELEDFWRPFVSLSFDDHAAQAYARIRTELAVQGSLIGPNDLIIAAIAFSNNLILVTHNTREFERVRGVQIQDWMGID